MVFNTTANSAGATDTSMLVDIAYGGIGSEVVLIQNLAFGWRGDKYLEYRIPVYLPVGTRLHAKAQSAVGSQTVTLMVVPITRPPTGISTSANILGSNFPVVKALNANTATSAGTVVTLPGATNTKGAWTEMIAATAEPYQALMVGVQGGSDVTASNASILLDIGIGASGSETTVIPNIVVITTTAELVTVPDSGAWLVNVPVGSRISARYQASATAGGLDVIVYGIR
jgi:hypothetical protein